MSHVSMTQTLCTLGEHLDTSRIEHDRMSILFRCNLNVKEVQLSGFAEQETYSRTCEHASPMTAPKHTHTRTHTLPGMLLAARIRYSNRAAGANGFLGSQRELRYSTSAVTVNLCKSPAKLEVWPVSVTLMFTTPYTICQVLSLVALR